MSKPMTKSELIKQIAEHSELKISDVKAVVTMLGTIGYKELKKSGSFIVPGFAKFVVLNKPATKERKGINPFTKEPTVFKARPARKIIRARPVKAAKDAVWKATSTPPSLVRRRKSGSALGTPHLHG
jgi:DNA-binding protein HU-beta